MGTTIPGNGLQERLHGIQRAVHRPSTGTVGKIEGKILQVYDHDTITADNVPQELCLAIIRKPGRMYCECKLANNRIVYLPLKESPEHIYAIYGDAKLIEGRPCYVVYYDNNIHLGEVVIAAQEGTALRDTKNSTNVFDIGGIF